MRPAGVNRNFLVRITVVLTVFTPLPPQGGRFVGRPQEPDKIEIYVILHKPAGAKATILKDLDPSHRLQRAGSIASPKHNTKRAVKFQRLFLNNHLENHLLAP